MSSEYINIGNKQLLVSLMWEEKEGKSKRQILSEIKKEAKESEMRFGYISEFKESEGSKKGACQYLLFEQGNTEVVLGSAIISDLFKDSIFVKKIDTDDIEEVKYWVCAVDNEGLIYDEGDKIITDEDELELFIEDMTALYEMNVVGFAEDFSFLSIELDVELEEDFLDSYLESQTYKIKELVKEKSATQKYITRVALGVTVAIGGFLAFYENDMYTDFENDVFSEMIVPMEKDLKKYKKANKKKGKGKKKTFSHNEYVGLGKKVFRDYYESTFFTNKEIVKNLLYLERVLEPYSMEWVFNKMAFKNNEFLIMYEKLENSIGVYADLDVYLEGVSRDNNVFDIIPVALVNNGKTRVYKVSFGENEKEKIYQARKLEEANTKTKEQIIEELEEEAKKIKSEVFSISENVKELNILEQIFSEEVELSYLNVQAMMKELKSIYKSINEEIARPVPPLVIDDSLVAGSELKYVEISQRDHLFSWSYPSKGNQFPSDKLVSKREAVGLKPFVKSYLVEMSSFEDISDGVMYMEEALNLIDKPFIQIRQVEVLNKDQKWGITSEVYEKISDLISEEENAKTIKSKNKKK